MCTCISEQNGIWRCSFFKREETQGKTSKSKGENQQRTQSTYDVDARIWSRATFVRGDCSHHSATLALLLSAWNNGPLCRWKSWPTILLLNLFPARFICTIMSSLTFPRSISLFKNPLFNRNYDSRIGFANIVSVLFCYFIFFQLWIIALVARAETIELAPAS